MGYRIIMKSLLRVKKKVCKVPYEVNSTKFRGKGRKLYTSNMCVICNIAEWVIFGFRGLYCVIWNNFYLIGVLSFHLHLEECLYTIHHYVIYLLSSYQ